MRKRQAKKKGKIIDRGKKKETLCWECGRATGGKGCPWADRLEPVEGWTVTQEKTTAYWNSDFSYIVHKCPLFIEG